MSTYIHIYILLKLIINYVSFIYKIFFTNIEFHQIIINNEDGDLVIEIRIWDSSEMDMLRVHFKSILKSLRIRV